MSIHQCEDIYVVAKSGLCLIQKISTSKNEKSYLDTYANRQPPGVDIARGANSETSQKLSNTNKRVLFFIKVGEK
jgi:hypothetical protein